MGCSAHHSVYVGDHERDIRYGIAAGSKTIVVRFGYTAPDEDIASWQADRIVDQANDVGQLPFNSYLYHN